MPFQYLPRSGFIKGVERYADPGAVSPNGLWDARNIVADELGALRVRSGIRSFTQPLGAGPVQCVISAFGGILIVWGRNLYRVDAQGQYTSIGSSVIGPSSRSKVEMVRWSRGGNEVVYIFAGNGLYETYGSSVSLVTPYTPSTGEPSNLLRAADGSQDLNSGPAKCTLAMLRASIGQRFVASGNQDSPNTVYFSAPLDATYWPANQILQLPDDGDVITALANWHEALAVFRRRDVWMFFGADVTASDASLMRQVTGVGCVASRTIADVPGLGLVFLGPDNVYALRAVAGTENKAAVYPVGDDIQHYLRGQLEGANVPWACAVYYDKRYRLSLPWAPVPLFERLVSEYASGWYPQTHPRAVQFVEHDSKLYFAGWENGKLFTVSDSRDDDGQPIPVYVAFRREMLFPGPSKLRRVFLYTAPKTLRYSYQQTFFGGAFGSLVFGQSDVDFVVLIIGKEASLTMHIVADGQERKVLMEPVAIARAPAMSIEDIDVVRVYRANVYETRAHSVQVRVLGSVCGEDFAVLGYVLEYRPRMKIRADAVE